MRQVTVSYDGSADAQIPISVHIGGKTTGVLNIKNGEGELINSFELGGKDAQNSVTVYWDGTDIRGQKVKAGNYLLEVEGEENDSSLYPYVQAVVEGVRFTADGVLVKIDGREISVGEVLDVSMGEEGTLTQSSALSLIGKTVRAREDKVTHSQSAETEHAITVNASANAAVTVEMKNAAGKVVATVRGTADASGKAELHWDGRDEDGAVAASGDYTIHVVGSDKNPSLFPYVEGVVDGLMSLGGGNFKLKVNGKEVLVSDIIDVTTTKG
jgi:flagellar hook assembly protein FlgD